MSDIMDRLLDTTDRDAVSDAREEIAALRAEVERLKEIGNQSEAMALGYATENERLRAALEGYVCTCTGGECAEQAGYRDECGKPARAALEEKP